MKALDVEAVQAFVLVADLNSFTRAAEALDTTQSSVSLKIKRLEDGLGRRLLERTPRRVRLSAEGTAFLGAARNLVAAHQSAIGAFAVEHRRLIVGISHHIVGAQLAALLKRMNATDPGLVIELHVDASRDVLASFDDGALDAAIVLGDDAHRRDGDVLFEEPFGWMAAPDFYREPGAPLRLATQAEPCSVRAICRWRAGYHRCGDFCGSGGGGAGAPGGAVGYRRSRSAAWSAAAAVAGGRPLFKAFRCKGTPGAAHPRRGFRGKRRLISAERAA